MAVLIAVTGLAVGGVALLGASPSRPARDAASRHPPAAVASSTDPPTTAAPTTAAPTTTVPVPAQAGSVTFTATRGGRSFAVQVLYPATEAGPGTPPLARGRPYPLVVFSPGFDIAPGAYQPLVQAWTVLGFVVAVPDYPFTAPGAAGGINEADITQHPADLEAVITQVLALSGRAGGVLTGMVDPSRIGVAGHSDGGDVTDAIISDSCCVDARVKAAAVLSGAELASFGGTYSAPRVPLLVTQGDADTTNVPPCSQQIYDNAGSPRYYLDLLGASHLLPYTADPAGVVYQQAVDRVTGLFWQAYLEGNTTSLATLRSGAGLGPETPLTVGAPVALTGSCPGAP